MRSGAPLLALAKYIYFMCFCGENVGLGARSLMGRDKVKSLRAPQPNPNLLSPPKHINSNWVLV